MPIGNTNKVDKESWYSVNATAVGEALHLQMQNAVMNGSPLTNDKINASGIYDCIIINVKELD